MLLYPYCNIPYIFSSRIRIQQKTDADSFSLVYHQPLVERTFVNKGELDAGLGLKCSILIFKHQVITIGAGYNFRLWQQGWNYAGNTIKDFPQVDCKGWDIGISWCAFRK